MEDGRSSSAIPQELAESILRVPGSRIVASGLNSADFTEKIVMFVNSGGGGEPGVNVKPDGSFEGGKVVSTEETIWDGGEFPSIYQTARYGDCGYRFNALPRGDYVVDLHFAEIVFTNGPKGMRVFNVFIQNEKVVRELDVYAIIGANKPLVVADIGVSVGEDGELSVRFEGVVGPPIVNGISIRQTAEGSSTSSLVNHEHLTCNNCAAEVKIPLHQKGTRMRFLVKYEEQIKELKAQCQIKADECHQAWMSLTATTNELEKARIELDKKFFQNMSLDQEMKKQTEALNEISTRHERDKMVWATAIGQLEKKVKMMKQQQSDLSSEAHECANSIPDLNKMIVAVQTMVAQYDDLKQKFNEEQMKRKELHNQLQEAKGNIRVFCRCRPFRKEEEAARHQTVVDFTAAKDGDLGIISGSTKKMFKFDRVFNPRDDQAEVFEDASPLVLSVLDGYNVCIFAYGQTGTGKTFTMEGPQQNRGVNYRTLQQLFKTIAERKETVTYEIAVSVLEVYNEQIRDLLATSSTTKRLEVKQLSEGINHVPGLVESRVGNVNEAWDVLQAGSNARAVGSNNVNERSSRSHCLLYTLVRAKNLITGECTSSKLWLVDLAGSLLYTLVRAKNLITGECTSSKLWLVDLAGSERLTKTDVQGERLKEAQNINKSLSALGDVISALANKCSHIPYRNSKLTHLLQDSLGGDSKTLMFVQISPSEHDLGETLSSLNFATRVRGVELGPPRKQTDVAELQKLKAMLDKAKHDLKSKDDMMRKLEDSVQNLESKASSKDQLCKNQHEKVNELEGQLASKTELCRKLEKQVEQLCKNQHDKVNELELQLASKTELCRKLEKQVEQLSDGIKGKEETYSSFQHKVKQLENKLKEYEQIDVRGLQSQVKELRNREKEIAQELECKLRERSEEFDNRMKERTQEYECHSRMMHEQMKALEEKLTQYEQQGESSFGRRPHSTPMTAASPMIETVCQIDPLSTRSLNSSSCDRAGQPEKSILLKGPEPLRELRRKRDSQGGKAGGSENSLPQHGSLLERKAASADQPDKVRQLDPSKAFARITRSTKPAAGLAQKPACPSSAAGSRSYRDHQVSGIREISKKHKVWLR